jgi:hypothetical protein
MLRHLAEIASLAVFANMAIDCARERSDDLQEGRLARNFESQPLQLIGKVGLPGGLRDLRQQPKCMCKPLVLRSSFESVFSGIGTCCGDPFDIGSSGDEADRRPDSTFEISEAFRGGCDPSAPL